MTNLNGNSGCSIKLIEKKDRFFIRKCSSSSSYNLRLISQMEKQANCKDMKSPKIFNSGFINDLFYFDMEYIDGITMASAFNRIDVSLIKKFIDNFIINNKNAKISYSSDTSENILKKLNDINLNISTLNYDFVEVFDLLKQLDWNRLPLTKCHGDLTLENILISPNGEFYYIDFLDSFIDSWIIDVAKLLQDFESKWSYRNEIISGNTLIRLTIAKDYLLFKLTKEEKMLSYGMLLIHLLRILQYKNSDKILVYVVNEINRIKNLLKELI